MTNTTNPAIVTDAPKAKPAEALLLALLLTLLAPLTARAQEQTLTVYAGSVTNEKVPAYINMFDEVARSQSVIPSAALIEMEGASINSMKFYTTTENIPYSTAENVDVYLMEVDYTTISACEPKTDANIVYQGSLEIRATGNGGELTINFSEPYPYTGGNLLVGIEHTENWGKYKKIEFYGQSLEYTASFAEWFVEDDIGWYAKQTEPQNFIPKTTFTYTPPACGMPETLAANDITAHRATLTWTGGSGTYNLETKAGNGQWTQELAGTNATTYTWENLNETTDYYARVQCVCGNNVSLWRAISFSTPVACLAPTELTVTLTPGNGSQATLGWTDNDSATEWQICLNDDEANLILASSNPFTLTNLIPDATYTAKVRACCNESDKSAWSNTAYFNTPCELVTITAASPYFQDFESPEGTSMYTPGPLPACWEAYTTNTDSGNPAPHNNTAFRPVSGTQDLFLGNTGTNYAILPESSNPINELQISFYMRTEGLDNGQLQLGYITDSDDGTCNTFVEIASYPNPSYMVQQVTKLPNVSAEAQRLVFRWQTSSYRCFIDDVEVSLNPDMIPPYNIAVDNITRIEADISWEGLCDSYDLRYQQIPGTVPGMTPILSEDFESGQMPQGWSIEGSNQDPDKTWRVGTGDDSMETGAHKGKYNALITHKKYGDKTYLVMPPQDLSGQNDLTLSFWYVNRKKNNTYGDKLAVYYRIGSEGTWNELWSTDLAHEGWTHQTIALPNLADNYQIGFYCVDYDYHGIGLDDIEISVYTEPSWTTIAEAENPYTIVGLTSGTDYEVQVKSNCTDHSNWSASVYFTTYWCEIVDTMTVSDLTATSVTLAWTGFSDSYNLQYRKVFIEDSIPILIEGFEGGQMPEGWSIEGDNQDPAKTWRIGTGDYNAGTGAYSGQYNALITHRSRDYVTYLIMPQQNMSGQSDLTLSFYYVNRKWGSDIDELAVCYRIGNEGTWNELWSTDEAHEGWTRQTIALANLADNCQIGFRCTDHYGYGIGLDSIRLVSQIYSPWITLSEAESPHTIVGLSPGTKYEARVQGICGDFTTPWSWTDSFTTTEATTYTKDIAAHTTDGGWYLIASPVAEAVVPTMENGFLANEFDLYRFNQSADLEWENWKKEGEHYHFSLESGQGYLYANSENVTLNFVGTPYAGNGEVALVRNDDESTHFKGWNLVGNPFTEPVYVSKPFYVMNALGTEIIEGGDNNTATIAPMEGCFVIADSDNETLIFSTQALSQAAERLSLNLIEAVEPTRGNSGPSTSPVATVIDRAAICFGEGYALPKFQLNPNSTKIYIPQGGQDYAIACIGRDGVHTVLENNSGNGSKDVARNVSTSVPVNFKAAKNGTYTLNVNVENMDLDYLHLIDNLTGADVDLLGNARHRVSTYTFTAKTTDYASRFRLVFSKDANVDNGDDAPFAYTSNGNIIITADARGASLQVVDVMGRVLICRDALNASATSSAISTTGMPAGMYVLRLIDGDSVRTQKIVIP